MNDSLFKRLLFAKSLHRKANNLLEAESKSDQQAGLLLLHDCIEMFLRIVTEQLNIPVKHHIAFNQLLDNIDNIGENQLSFRTQLNQLNQARLNLKHFGNYADVDDLKKFSRDMSTFLQVSASQYLDLDFSSLSLIENIPSPYARKLMKDSRRMLDEEEYVDSVIKTAIAFKFFQAKYSRPSSYVGSSSLRLPRELRELSAWAEHLEKKLEDLSVEIEEASLGFSRKTLRELRSYLPNVMFSLSGNYQVSIRHSRELYTRDIAEFCFNNSLEYMLNLSENREANTPRHATFAGTVTQPCEVLDRLKQEPMAKLQQNEKVAVFVAEDMDENGLTAILIENELGYIRSELVDYNNQR